MSIQFDTNVKTFTLLTRSTAYQMQVSSLGRLLHLYYGRRVEGGCLDYQYPSYNCSFSPHYYENRVIRNLSPDILPQEYSGSNTGDYRLPSVQAVAADGSYGVDLLYESYEIKSGKYALEGLPAAFARKGEAETLSVTLRDPVIGLKAELLYGVFADQDIITRAVRFTNESGTPIRLDKAASLCLDLPFGEWELLHLHGRHTMERQPERVPLMNGIQTVASNRGASSHHHNPFVALCAPDATEQSGECYGAMLVYSGSHREEVEVNQMGSARLVMGINPEGFEWKLEPGETFTAPEALLTFSWQGLTRLSHNYHGFIRDNIIRSKFSRMRRPVLINNWEATYFHFTSEKILRIAKQAAELGVEMLVLDDGWFGARNDDNRGLGDWDVNEEKLPGGLDPLIAGINALGMKFGIWVEPEMVNEDSDLYRAHPDWALTLPGRKPAMCRNQMVLDFSRPDVVEYFYQKLSNLLRSHHIEYIKWDMNRNMTDVYSRLLPSDRQGEVAHRYMLGLYNLLERLTTEFPDVLFEGCSGGGGRFDAGMMAYFPQIWCSDDTDAIERLTIQYGTSLAYPISTVGSHVSICPNHQTGRTVPIDTRAVIAMAGTFGYELDLAELTDEEREAVREQIVYFKKHYDLIQNGDYYRLTGPRTLDFFTAWAFVSEDKREVLLNVVVDHPRPNPMPMHLRFEGLDPDGLYDLKDARYLGCHMPNDALMGGVIQQEGLRGYLGSNLMYAGFTLPQLYGDYPSVQLYFVKE